MLRVEWEEIKGLPMRTQPDDHVVELSESESNVANVDMDAIEEQRNDGLQSLHNRPRDRSMSIDHSS